MLVSHLTPRDAEEVLATLGHMQPSKSSLDRLPKALSARWEAQRETFETTVRETTVEVPDAARAVVVSLDGVMAPMRGGYREAGCATVSLVDAEGERLHSVRMGRMPESHKATLKTMVAAEVEAVLAKRPDLALVKIADGAKGQLDVSHPRAARGGRAHRLLPRRRASQRRLRHRPRDRLPHSRGAVQEVPPSVAP